MGVRCAWHDRLHAGWRNTRREAQTGPLRLGVLTDMSSLYADNGGPGSVVAAQMAVDDFGGTVLGRKIEVVPGDHQNKADIGGAIDEAMDRQ